MQRGRKKGQVTLFIILGIIIVTLAIILVYFYSSSKTGPGQEEIQQRLDAAALEPIKELIKTCTKASLEKGIIKIGLQGGYYDPAYFVQLGNYSVSYVYINKQNRLPTLYQISREIEAYSKSDEAKEEIDSCINGFKSFKKAYDMDIGKYELKVGEISDTSIPVEITYPITVSKEDVSLQISKVAYTIDSGLGTAYKVAVDIVNEEIATGSFDTSSYILSHSPLATIERQSSEGNIFYYLDTIPQEAEKAFKFHFIIKK